MRQSSSKIWSVFNPEKTVFFVASTLLLYAGFQYQNIPNMRSWTAARTEMLPKNISPLDLSEPPPVGEFLLGSRRSPFMGQTGAVQRDTQTSKGEEPSRSTGGEVGDDTGGTSVGFPEPPELPEPPDDKKTMIPMRVGGIVSLGNGAKHAIFISEEDSKHYVLREGEKNPGLDLRVVQITKAMVIVKNKRGKHRRRDDMLKASSGRNTDSEE